MVIHPSLKALTNSPFLPTPYRPLTDPLHFQSKLELILEMKDRLTTSLRRAKDAVSQSTASIGQYVATVKLYYQDALDWLKAVGEGTLQTDLPQLPTDEYTGDVVITSNYKPNQNKY